MKFLGRDAFQLENDTLRVTVLAKGCNIAEMLHKQTGINPLWIPPWSKELSRADPLEVATLERDGQFLSNVMGHHICLDTFGDPSEEERAAGLELHGEASIAPYDCYIADDNIHASAHLKKSSLGISRSIHLGADGNSVNFSETVENFLPIDRPIAWTQHVTLGPPFLIPGVTRICINPTHSRVSNATMEHSTLERNADFTWPAAPSLDSSICDLSIFADRNRAASLTTHRMEGHASEAGFTVFCL